MEITEKKTKKTRKPSWLKMTAEEEAREFWVIHKDAEILLPDACGGGYTSYALLPNLVWLRVFLDAGFHIPNNKIGNALSYEMELMPKQRKRLIFKGLSRSSKEPKEFSFSKILALDARKLIPFKRKWTADLLDVRKAPRARDYRSSKVSTGQLRIVEESLNDLTGYKPGLWKRSPEDKLRDWKPPIFSSTYRADELTELVLEDIKLITLSARTKGAKRPAKSVARKALSELVQFEAKNIKNPQI